MSLGRAYRVGDSVTNGRVPLFLGFLGVLAQGYTAWLVLGGHPRPPITRDSALFQHAGWYVRTGAAPYADVWDPKPPLTFEFSALVSALTNDPYLLHLVHVSLMSAAAVGSVVLAGLLTKHLTDDPMAGVVGGASMLVLPGYLVRPTLGLKPKYYVLFAGLLALYLFARGRFTWSGVAAGAAVGFWQIGVVYPFVVSGLAVHRGDRRVVGRVLAGVGAAAAVVLVPVVLWGALEEMVVQTVVVSLLFPEEFTIPQRLYWGVRRFKFGSLLVPLAGYGVYRFVRERPDTARTEWWLLACAGWFAFVALFVDFDIWSYTDLIPGLPFVAIGVGLLYAHLDAASLRRALVSLVAVVVVLNVFLQGGFGLAFDPVPVSEPDEDLSRYTTMDGKTEGFAPAPASVSDVRYLYWNRVRPDNCHLRYSLLELHWIRATGRYPNCGDNLDEALAMLRE
ncbi:MAG: DolP-mannose mannosyltransferase [Haloarculaceae archaeon]